MSNYKFQMKSFEESYEIMEAGHSNHTFDCCPQINDIDFTERNAAINYLVGEYPVYGSPMSVCKEVRHDMKQIVSGWYYDDKLYQSLVMAIHNVFDRATADEWANNVISKDNFETLKTQIKEHTENYEHSNKIEFQLIKKSSPKLSNLIASILKVAGRDPQNDEIMRKFNARQANQMNDYTMYISIEPHRITGMSAYGLNYTSCQDYIKKDRSHDYHHYTHQVWANLLDGTCGIAYIRRNEDDREPNTDRTARRDMVARSLVRAVTLPNGQVMVYLGRVYGASPFDQVIRETFNRWEKTLPENYHVIKMYDNGRGFYDNQPNKFGIRFQGYTTYTEEQVQCKISCGAHHECEDCGGEGRQTCPCCDGSGTVYVMVRGYDSEDNCYEDEQEFDCRQCDGDGYVECNECGGRGSWDDDDDEVEPYNDHSDWLSFRYDGVRYQVPNSILHWDDQPAPLPDPKDIPLKAKQLTDEISVGDFVTLVEGSNPERISAVPFSGKLKVLSVTRHSDGKIRWVELSNHYSYKSEMVQVVRDRVTHLDRATRKLPVGSKVKIRDDISTRPGYRMFFVDASNCVNDSMMCMAGKVVTITSNARQYTIEGNDWHWVDEMFELVKVESLEEVQA